MTNGPIIAALNAAKAMLRDCYYFRSLVTPDSPMTSEQAASRIYFDGLPPADPGPNWTKEQLNQIRPFAIIFADNANGMSLRSDTAGNCCAIVSGTIIIQLELPIPSSIAADPTDVADYLYTAVGLIMRSADDAKPGLYDLSGQAGYLPINQLKMVGIQRTDRKTAIEIGDCAVVELEIAWGQE